MVLEASDASNRGARCQYFGRSLGPGGGDVAARPGQVARPLRLRCRGFAASLLSEHAPHPCLPLHVGNDPRLLDQTEDAAQLASISRARSAFCSRNWRTFSRPWPSRVSP